jgi:RNA polymerase sigma-70 factor (ECF subfamily)
MTTGTPESLSPEALDEIVLRTRNGDEKAMERIILDLQGELRLFIAARADSLDMVEDVLQSTFVICFRKLDTYEPRGTFLAWLKGIAKNRLLQELKERSRYVALEGGTLEGLVADHQLKAIEKETGREAEYELARLLECVERLPARTREMVMRRYRDRTPVKKLARQFKKRAGAIAALLTRARRSIRLCMESNGASV